MWWYTYVMGWFDRLSANSDMLVAMSDAENSVEERRLGSIGDPETAALLGYAWPGSPVVSEQTALTLSAVYRAVSLVSGSIASLPLRTMDLRDGRSVQARSVFDDPCKYGLRLTAFEWKELIAIHLLLHGNAYLQHITNGAGSLVGMIPLHPTQVTVELDSSAADGRRYKVATDDGAVLNMDSTKITHIMGFSLDGLRGVSAITMARMSMGTALSGDKAANRQFQNGGMISGIVTPEGDDPLGVDEAKIVKQHINRVISGPENAGDIPVINRKLKFTPWTLSAADAQFLESRTFQIDEVGRWFGVPPHLLGLTEKSTSWGQGIAEQNRGLSRFTLSPWTSRIQERLSLALTGKWVEFDYKSFVKPSPEDEIRLLIEQVNAGLLTLNEAREIMNLPSVTGGEKPRVPAGAADPNSGSIANEGGASDGSLRDGDPE